MIRTTRILSLACALLAGASTLSFGGKEKNKTSADPVLITLGTKPVYVKEFKYVYNKNNTNAPDAYSEKSLKEYLDLYTNFRLKVLQAEDLGMDTAQSFKRELEGYKKQLAQPYLTEKSVTDQLIKEAYQRLQEDVKASHILIMVSPDAEPKDTLIAYKKLMDIRQRALKGESFEQLAREFSQDPSAKENGGNIGYFTVLQMVYPFEDAAYKTPVGEISLPFRTKFGYHLVKVTDRRKSQGEVKVAHIMSRFNAGGSAEDSATAYNKIQEIYTKLKGGGEWDQLCEQFSDDVNSKNKGGVLPAFTTGTMIPSFEEASHKLKNPGDYVGIIQTPYGFHIIKLVERKPIQKFEEVQASLKQKVTKDSRSDLNKTVLLERLKKENGLKENKAGLQAALSTADSNLLIAKWNFKADKKENKLHLFTLNKTVYTVKNFLDYVKAKQAAKKNISPAHYMNLLYKDYVNETVLAYEEAHLDQKYEDYRLLVKEYRDGILLFQLMDEKVWTKAVEDTAGIKSFYAENKNKYMWDKRVEALIYSGAGKEVIQKFLSILKKDVYPVYEEKADKVLFDKGKAELTSKAKQNLEAAANLLAKDHRINIEWSVYAEANELPNPKKLVSDRKKAILSFLKSKLIDSTRILFNETTVKSLPKKGKTASMVNYRYASFGFTTTSRAALEKSFNAASPLNLIITDGKFQKGENLMVDSLGWKRGEYEVSKGGRYYHIKIGNTVEPTPKSFDEARGLIISDYQSYLEKRWIAELKAKYPVKINEEEAQKMIKK